MLKSISGQDFTQFPNGLTFERDLQCSAISVDPNNSNVLMLATGEENDAAVIGNGAF